MKAFSLVILATLLFSFGCELFEDEPEKPKVERDPFEDITPPNAGYACADIDGLDYFHKSYVIAGKSGTRAEDNCVDDKTLAESYCKDGMPMQATLDCPKGCKDGACMNDDFYKPAPKRSFENEAQEETCYDADGGANYATKSYIVIGGNNSRQYFDECKGPDRLQEWMCQPNGRFDAQLYTCIGICTDGHCESK